MPNPAPAAYEIVLDFEQAMAVVGAQAASLSAPPGSVERVALLESLGRVLAEPIVADRDQPPFDRSARDGFALQAADWNAGSPLSIVGEVRAGGLWAGHPVASGEAIRIMTGAPVPAGADAVVMVEHAAVRKQTLTGAADRTSPTASAGTAARAGITPGEHIVPRGSEARAGAVLVEPGRRISAAEIALAAACGYPHLTVQARPTVAILATGDELVELDRIPGAQQIRNSNSYALAAMVEQAGSAPVRLPTCPDDRDALSTALATARQADLVLLSGGVSMGDYDLVEEILRDAGAEFFFSGVRMQPGKPVVFGRLPGRGGEPERFFFALPGNPISTQVTFHCFVEPFLRALGGEPFPGPRWAYARLSEPAEAKPGLTRLPPAELSGGNVRVVPTQGSGDLAANSRANCHAELLPGRAVVAAGTFIRILLRQGQGS